MPGRFHFKLALILIDPLSQLIVDGVTRVSVPGFVLLTNFINGWRINSIENFAFLFISMKDGKGILLARLAYEITCQIINKIPNTDINLPADFAIVFNINPVGFNIICWRLEN